ncbi:phenylacetaldehyde dehydrogenase [Altererythrobacter atlanticus]|uniref:Aldehyde dehydrogenase PuuC n=1 Tax=Croceibacterium atlanticum TaxID=1267766 RepID=A0A0F7KVI8_9SPHN|nr:aldehyde dehydrogenase family protein [Croceibacterium atlanticum]AKH43684.1 Aldehyde dehydrogenase PuuC [Croceibacterium atlanticum]MBB5733832.1 phenylacetaldehyde dehydrogenase [Croceibacterium atlanticum]
MNAETPIETRLEAFRSRWSGTTGKMLIGGEWREAASGETFATEDPATGEKLADVASAGQEDVDAAVAAARAAFEGPWSKVKPDERAKLINRLADLIEKNGDELALTETLDVGRPIQFSRIADVGGAVSQLRYQAGWATKLQGETNEISAPGEWLSYVLREPIGVCGQIVPWNFPLAMACGKLGPAMAAGCTVVLKPAEQTPLSTIRLGELALEAGFPEGVINVVTGYGRTSGAMLANHMDVDKVAFTGSTETGKAIIEASKTNFKRISLELGGKSPTFIFADADLKKAIPAAAMGIFFNAGQVCAAGSRLFVQEEVADQVLEGIAGMAKMLRVGHTLDPETVIGPLVSQQQLDRVTGYIESGRQEGATVMVGGGRKEGAGWFVEPTVLVDTEASMKVRAEEIFGPVLCATRFAGEDDADRLAALGNETQFGLAASIWTKDIGMAHRLARRLKAGTIRINGSGGVDPALPLGGFKASGWGRENGRAGVEAYTELKAISVALD